MQMPLEVPSACYSQKNITQTSPLLPPQIPLPFIFLLYLMSHWAHCSKDTLVRVSLHTIPSIMLCWRSMPFWRKRKNYCSKGRRLQFEVLSSRRINVIQWQVGSNVRMTLIEENLFCKICATLASMKLNGLFLQEVLPPMVICVHMTPLKLMQGCKSCTNPSPY